MKAPLGETCGEFMVNAPATRAGAPDEAIVAERKLGVSESRVRLLQGAAHETVARFAGE